MNLYLDEKLALFLGKFGIWNNQLKYYVWSRKIIEQVEIMENTGQKKDIKSYLEKCVYYRKKFLKEPLTKIELNQKIKVGKLLNQYQV